MFKHKLIMGLYLSCFALGLSIRSVESRPNTSAHLATFFQAFELIQKQALQKVPSETLMTAAAQGLVQALDDPYSSFFTPTEFASLKAEQSGELVGVGLELAYKDQQVLVMSVLENTPAERTNLQSGDIILAINNEEVADLNWYEINQRLSGKLNAPINLTYYQKSTGKKYTVTLYREPLNLKAIDYKRYDNGICHLKIYTFFKTDLHKDILNSIQTHPSCNALILDLQNNPGGLLDEAVKLAGSLGVQGDVVQIINREGEIKALQSSEPAALSPIPILVLINQGTASAAEILAASLSESGRALTIGQQSFGKARVQNLLPLPDGSGLSLTTDKYLTRKGKDINELGVIPDIRLNFETGEKTALNWALSYLQIAIQP